MGRTECFLSSHAVKHDWEKMTESVQNHIGSLNWGYRVALREKKVYYENAYGKFIGSHKIKVTVKLHSPPLLFHNCFHWCEQRKSSPVCFLKIRQVSKLRLLSPGLSSWVTLLSHLMGPSVGHLGWWSARVLDLNLRFASVTC